MAAVVGHDWTADLAARLARVMPEPEAHVHLPLIESIRQLKAAHGAVVVAHNYQVPLITAGIADFTGDSLAMARYAAQTDSDTIVVCGVRFMAETAKLLCPARRVLLPAPDAGCSLAESITAADVRALRGRHPGVPIVAYVNTTAAVKAEVDICCTSANAVEVVRSLASPRVILLPDRFLASFVAERVACEVIPWPGSCEVHERFSAADIRPYRGAQVRVLAHPECPPDVQAAADFVGSTAAMIEYLNAVPPGRVLLLTECSMADNVLLARPDIQFERPCNLCRHMKAVTLEKVRDALQDGRPTVDIDADIAERARRPLQRMLELGPAGDRAVTDDRSTDVLVVGAGIAGLCVALGAAPRRVLVLCPDAPARTSSSALAQGGIAAPVGPGDSVAGHVGDTLAAACHSADPEAVIRVIGGAVDALAFLEASGVDFDRDGSGRSLHLEAGHRRARIAHVAGDRSGEAIVAALWACAGLAPHIEILNGWRAVALLASPGEGVCGAQIAGKQGRSSTVHARETVLATGGIGRLYRHTTNGEYATGDGLAMALALGARTAALEFVQFHPTALRVDADPLPLLTEALRGAGARLITAAGAPVMAGRHVLGDLAPRDVVARAVWEHARAGEDVLLDATTVFTSDKASAFPGARGTALAYGIDPAVAPLPVTAAAHYHMGGLIVDASGRTSIAGLWACGEVAYTGLHGANRLASNSLLEAVVCGQATGTAIAAASSRSRPAVKAKPLHQPAALGPDGRWSRLRDRMWHSLGPVRDAGTLRAALTATATEADAMGPEDGLLKDRFALATAMFSAAAVREESRGAHWRSDFPRRDPGRDGPRAVYPHRPTPAAAAGTDSHHKDRPHVRPID